MTARLRTRTVGRWLFAGVAAAVAAYGAYAAVAWLRYGHASPATDVNGDPLLDRFMPIFEIAERHHIRVDAPAAITLTAACEADLEQSPVVRAIFRARERVLGSEPVTNARPRGLLASTQSLGWAVLAEVPGRQVIMGAVTRPWEADVTFRGLPPDEFIAFDEPGYVKIAWTLRADPIGAERSVFRTETRAVATSPEARRKFRRYWSLLSPGIIVIRWMMLTPVKSDAERRVQRARSTV